ncbi:hypothetical protein KBY22_15850 [Ruegeria pomeroyi]|uniref:DUF4136 domain-containing protein n=1 Tax=Ruegeria alba TaxID=2916756 RepID=A0ABS9NZJ1_9RHOB|nr:hypothetical protein [Ruegeria alba]MCE8514180.1 hypothetical protein [Ruegeria pomeroyi]MCE8523492.1 hypothetical protein [Ruegeria pomeroyi]MCE8531617.1 hypothetical protein [Ruegeria pomeroyi]MCG6559658.1 hypothetical protein [Ruegeria alba]
MIRVLTLLTGLALLAACTAATPDEPLEELGAFKLGHNVVVASKAQKGPISRDATAEEWETALKAAVGERFSRYQGEQYYHLGISVEGYMLAPPGVPVIYSPKSALIINVTVWDDASQTKLNPEVEQFTVFEATTGESWLMGSGNARTKEEQLMGLSRNAVGEIEDWLVEQHKENGWFAPRPDAESATGTPQAPVKPAQG